MKKYLLPLIFVFALACSSSVKEVTINRLTLPEKPQAGKEISIQYNKDSGQLSTTQIEDITLYYTVGSIIYAKDIGYTDKKKSIKATFTLPDSAQAFALKFHGSYTDKNGGIGYVFPVYDSSDQYVKGALAGASLFYNTRQSLLRLSQNPDTALFLLKKEFKTHPKEKRKWIALYLKTLLQVHGESAYNEVQEELKWLLSSDTVQKGAYHLAYNLYNRIGMPKRAESVKAVGMEKYPHGLLAEYDAIRQFNNEQQVDSLFIYYGRFKKKFPGKGMQGLSSEMKNLMASRIALAYSKQGKYPTYFEIVSQMNNPIDRASAYINVATSLVEAKQNFELADSLLLMSLPLMKKSMDHPGEEKPTYLTDKNWENRMKLSYGLTMDTYALSLFYQHRINDAVKFQHKAVLIFSGRNREVNERYFKYLSHQK